MNIILAKMQWWAGISRAVSARWSRWFGSRPANADASQKKAKRRKQGEPPENWVEGDYASAQMLLEDLQERYAWLKSFMAATSKAGKTAINSVGVYMVPGMYGIENCHRLDGGDGRPWPTYMTMAMYQHSDCEKIGASDLLVYAQKHRWKHNSYLVARPQGRDFYEMGMVMRWDGEHREIRSYIEVLPDETIVLLRAKEVRTTTTPGARSRRIHHAQWTTPLMPLTAEMENAGRTSVTDREEGTIKMFRALYNNHLRRDASTSIYATKGSTRMVFTVPTNTWKDFFKDRVEVTGPGGSKKRIFHHVAAHTRANGRTVKMHTRGLTRFKWAGFNIKICEWKPGRISASDLTLAPEVFTKAERKGCTDLMSEKQFSKKLRRHLTADLHIPKS